MAYNNVASEEPWDRQGDNGVFDDELGIDTDDFIVNDEDDGRGPPAQAALGHIPEPPQTQTAGGERLEQRRFMGGDTLDEPVLTTIMRDVRAFGVKLRQIVWIYKDEGTENKDWDLWGPLIFCLLISTLMSMIAPNHQSSIVFSGVFSLIWVGQLVVTLNIKMLGGTISFFHALCITGYSLFPLVIGALVSSFVSLRVVRMIVDGVLAAWSIYSATSALKNSGVLPSRVFLATYPVGLFYVGIGWLCVIT